MTDTTTSDPRQDEQRPDPVIIVGVDGSPASKQALRWAGRLAGGLHARIEAVAVWEIPSTFGWSALPPLVPPHPQIEKLLVEAVDEVFGAHRPVEVTTQVLEGTPAVALLAAARNARMLVVGSRGRGAVSGLMMGSVSRRVSERAQCPVLVVHEPAARRGAAQDVADEPSTAP